MPKEELFIRVIQAAIALNTILLFVAIWAVRKGNLKLHIQLGSWVVLSTLAGVLALVVTVILGWNYHQVLAIDPTQMMIHRCFSVPLLILLPIQGFLGWRRIGQLHRRLAPLTLVFWLGTTITGIWFF
jgi:hypothetical protein